MGFSPGQMLRTYGETLVRVRYSLLTIAAMLALGYVTKYSGTDATLGLALAKTGVLYPFFGTLLGWLGVALTGSDTASNVLFGSLQKITANQMGVSATLMAAANSSGGVMGKMVDAQSIVVASTATNYYGHEGQILRTCSSTAWCWPPWSESWSCCKPTCTRSRRWSYVNACVNGVGSLFGQALQSRRDDRCSQGASPWILLDALVAQSSGRRINIAARRLTMTSAKRAMQTRMGGCWLPRL